MSVPAIAQTGGTKPIYGAIAYSPNSGSVGYTWHKATRAVASQGAIGECKAADCKVVTEFWGRCGALAVGTKGWGAAHAETQATAESAAVAACSKHTQQCKVIRWVCSK